MREASPALSLLPKGRIRYVLAGMPHARTTEEWLRVVEAARSELEEAEAKVEDRRAFRDQLVAAALDHHVPVGELAATLDLSRQAVHDAARRGRTKKKRARREEGQPS